MFSALGAPCNHRLEGELLAFPAAVAIHGVITSRNGSNFADLIFPHLLLKLCEISGA